MTDKNAAERGSEEDKILASVGSMYFKLFK